MRVFSKTLLVGIFVSLLLGVGSSAAAFPPRTVSGIDLSTVLTFDDRARQLSHHESEDDQKGDSLEHVRTIVLDPGHGGGNSGAEGVAHVKEKHLTLELAYHLREHIQERYPGVRVILTRYWDTDMDLSRRTHIANIAQADLFLSLHYNAAPHDRAVGYETYFLEPEVVTPGEGEKSGEPVATAESVATGLDEDVAHVGKDGTFNDSLVDLKRDLDRERLHRESGLLANVVQQNMDARLDSTNRGVKQAKFDVLRGALMPSVVVESGFLTHPDEGKEVLEDEHRQKLISALTRAIEQFDAKLAERD
ncbi:MAG: N-acetylmuramoyl-L-alanine amidase family protein [Persicimonas sp.]